MFIFSVMMVFINTLNTSLEICKNLQIKGSIETQSIVITCSSCQLFCRPRDLSKQLLLRGMQTAPVCCLGVGEILAIFLLDLDTFLLIPFHRLFRANPLILLLRYASKIISTLSAFSNCSSILGRRTFIVFES